MRKIFLLFTTTILLSSCLTEIDMDFDDVEPMLVMNSIIGANKLLKVQISTTHTMLSDNPESIKGANVNLYENNLFIETLHYVDSTGLYHADFIPMEKNKYGLEASLNGYPTISAEDSIPEAVQLNHFAFTSYAYTDPEWGDYSEVIIDFTDPSQNNWYETAFYSTNLNILGDWNNELHVFVPTDTTDIYTLNAHHYTSSDPVILNENILQFNPPTLFFSDDLLDGDKKLALNIIVVSTWVSHYNVVLRTTSYGYYLARKKWVQHLYNQGVPERMDQESFSSLSFVGSPVEMFSNVKNGLGIVVAYSESHFEIIRPQ